MSRKRFALAGALKGSTALLGPMTAAERSKGRYMRAPEGHDDAEFAAFEAAGDVEVGKPEIETNEAAPEKPAKPARAAKPAAAADKAKDAEKPAAAADKAKGAEKPAAAAAAKAAGKGAAAEADAGEGEGDAGEGEGEEDEDEEEEEDKPKPKKKASDRIRELTAGRRADQRVITQLSSRLEALEKGGLPAGGGGSNSRAADIPAPDVTDAEKYPLGHLDDRYIEDKLDWLAEQKATKMADAALQREQGREQTEQAQRAHNTLLEKVDDLSTRGSELFDDFQESVVEAGMRGDWRLDQPTFEAAHEAEHGAQILYDLSQDTKEAARVAGLSPFQQAKFVLERDTEIARNAKPRTKPGAEAPPATRTRGANSSSRINPATDNLNDFEKAWAADEKANG